MDLLRESFLFSLIVCSLCVALSFVMLILIWVFVVRKNKNQYYVNDKEVKDFEKSL